MTYINYKGKQYEIIHGPNGGKYINVDDKKIYINKITIKKNIKKKNIKKKNKNNSKNIDCNLEVVVMNDTNILRKILKKVEMKDGQYMLPENHFSKHYYERLTGFEWNNLYWE